MEAVMVMVGGGQNKQRGVGKATQIPACVSRMQNDIRMKGRLINSNS